MTSTTDIDLGLDFDELAKEEARLNRRPTNHNPIIWEGDFTDIGEGSEMFGNGTEYPRVAFTFAKNKFIDPGNSTLQDGDTFVLMLAPVADQVALGIPKRFTQMAKTTLASGKDLKKFLHQRVRVTEITETYTNKKGYPDQSYHWKFETLAGVSSGPSPDKDIKFAETEAIATRLWNGGDGWANQQAFIDWWLNAPENGEVRKNSSADFTSLILLDKWEGFKNLGTPAA